MLRGPTAPVPANYAWIFDVLAGTSPVATWAIAGELPAGFERAERFGVLPAGAGRSFLVSLASRRASSSALTSYNALRPARRRLARGLLGAGLRCGLAQPLIREKIDIGVAAGAAPQQLAEVLLSEHLRQFFGREIIFALGGGSGPYRKPVLQVFGRDGTPLGYVKVGWNDWTKDAVRREARALRSCADHRMRLRVPALLDHSAWRGLELLITAPLPPGVRRFPIGSGLPDVALLKEINQLAPVQVSELRTSPWWQELRTRIPTGMTDPAGGATLARLADRIERSSGQLALAFGGWHGDLVPWNLARLGDRICAWDWESSAGNAPVGFDALHFHFQVAFVARRCPVDQAAVLAARKAGPALDALGIAPDSHRLVAALHLLELLVRHEQARASSGEADDRFYPAVTRVLDESIPPQPPCRVGVGEPGVS